MSSLSGKNFTITPCPRCENNNFYLINSTGLAIEVKCQTCKKKRWIKAENKDFKYTLLKKYTLELLEKVGQEGITLQSNIDEDDEERKNHQERHHIPQSIQDKVWNRDGGKCVKCGSNEKLEFDHIIPISKGGANTYRNIQLLCEKCNREKSDKIG